MRKQIVAFDPAAHVQPVPSHGRSGLKGNG